MKKKDESRMKVCPRCCGHRLGKKDPMWGIQLLCDLCGGKGMVRK